MHPELIEPALNDVAAVPFMLREQLFKYHTPATIQAKMTHSTHLATQMKGPSHDHIPSQFWKYATVFSEQAAQWLPQHQPWDHTIDLKLNTVMKKCEVYHLTPAEMNALQTYIDDHLKKGYIRISKSPVVSPFFFVNKKDGKLCPV